MRALEDQVRVEFEASLQYILMAAHFDQVRPGLGTGREGAGWRGDRWRAGVRRRRRPFFGSSRQQAVCRTLSTCPTWPTCSGSTQTRRGAMPSSS